MPCAGRMPEDRVARRPKRPALPLNPRRHRCVLPACRRPGRGRRLFRVRDAPRRSSAAVATQPPRPTRADRADTEVTSVLIRLLRSHLGPYKRPIGLLVALQLVSTIAALFLPTLNADIIDNGVVK